MREITHNPEAGLHNLATDPVEIAAAQRASDRSWQEFPYYEARFGERGRRFGLSDSSWLVSLCSGTAARAVEQVRWLGTVLSSRGMPQILLERHLQILHEELGGKRYAVLLRCADDLRKRRSSVIAEPAFDTLSSEFESRTRGLGPGAFGPLLVSAVADEGNGIERAVSSLRMWAADSERFPKRWVQAVDRTIARARAARKIHEQ